MKKVGLIALFASLAISEVFAGTLVSYAAGDVLVGFRKTGAVSDLVVDAGPISTFTNASVNQRITITQYYTTNQLYTIGLNSLIFSAFTWIDNSTVSQDSAILFVSKARSSINTQTTPLPQAPAASQFTVSGDMGSVQAGGGDSRNNNVLNTDTGILEPDDTSSSVYVTGRSYSDVMGLGANFSGDFGGLPEIATPSGFTTGGAVVRSDFYWIPPSGSGAVKFLGYFELNTNGVLSYVAYPTGVPTVPVIQSITRTNTTSYVRFTTGNSGTYTLRGTNSTGLSTARTNWPAITAVAGNGAANTLQDTTTADGKFYVITAQ